MNLCSICLRTDKLLKIVSNVLRQFHDELCGLSVLNVSSHYYYCIECKYHLRKLYKFKQKCVKAHIIYQEWMSQVTKTQPINLLYTLLPASSLGMWVPSPDKIRNFTFEETDPGKDLCYDYEYLEESYIEEVEKELDQNHNSGNVKQSTHSKNMPCGSQQNKIMKSECVTEHSITNGMDKSLDKSSNTETAISSGRSENKISNKILKTLKEPCKNVTTIKKEIVEHSLKKSSTKKNPTKKIVGKRKALIAQRKENYKMYESVFDIEHLTSHEMQLEEFQKRKTYEYYVNAEHKCEICFQVFKSLKLLKYHTNKRHHENSGSALCPICNIWVPKNVNQTNKHKRTHHIVFKCKLCSFITYHRQSMQSHFEQHAGKKFHCEQCNITYKSKSGYWKHLRRAHRRGRHVCARCGRGFLSSLGLAVHRNNSSRCTLAGDAAGAPGVRCDECDVTLSSQEVYDAHIFDVHQPSQPVRTLNVINSVGLPETVISNAHTNKPRKYNQREPVKVTCRVCSKFGGSYSWLQLHFKREHPHEDIKLLYADKRRHLCDVCGAGFSTVYVLRDHMNKHTGTLPHSCDLCPKQFRTSVQLQQHRARHFPSTLPCTHCGKMFKTAGNLHAHMKIHTGVRDYKCDICGKGFLHSTALNEHVRGVHHNIRRSKRAPRGPGHGGAMGPGGHAKRKRTDDQANSDGTTE